MNPFNSAETAADALKIANLELQSGDCSQTLLESAQKIGSGANNDSLTAALSEVNGHLNGESSAMRFLSAGPRPNDYEFNLDTINNQTRIALNYPHTRSPYYASVPAIERFPALQGTKHVYDTVVIGGGLMGSQTARALAASGRSVAVLDSGLVADGASGALAGMGTRALDASYPALEAAMGPGYGQYVQQVSKARDAIRESAKGLSETRYGINSHMYSYEDDPDFRAEFDALHRYDPQVRWSSGADAAKIIPAVGDRPAAQNAISFLNESRVNARQLVLSQLDHPKISTYENSPVVGIHTGIKGEPIEVHTADGGVVRAGSVVSAINGLPTMFRSGDLLQTEQARMISGNVPTDLYPFTRDNHFDFGNAVSRNDEDYAWWLMRHPGVVDLGADSRFLTAGIGDRATQGIDGLKENFRHTFPGVEFAADAKPWGSVLFGTKTGGPMVDTLPENKNVMAITGAGGTGLVNGRQAAWAVRDMLNHGKKTSLYTPEAIAQIGQKLDDLD